MITAQQASEKRQVVIDRLFEQHIYRIAKEIEEACSKGDDSTYVFHVPITISKIVKDHLRDHGYEIKEDGDGTFRVIWN